MVKIDQFMKLARELGMDVEEDYSGQVIVYTNHRAVYDNHERQGYEKIKWEKENDE